jgi:hypothetical protein
MLIQVIAGNEENLPNTRAWRTDGLLDATVMVNIKQAPDALLYTVLGGYHAPFDRRMTAFARSDHLSLFATPSLIAHYAREGLPAVRAPVTVMTNPSSETTVTGSRFLLAGATDSYGVKKVQFVLTGGTLHRKVIASGSPQYFGWLGGWNSTTVPNGTYKLQSIAFSHGGKTGLSPGITITVANGPAS